MIPSSVTSIDANAFYGYNSLKEIIVLVFDIVILYMNEMIY